MADFQKHIISSDEAGKVKAYLESLVPITDKVWSSLAPILQVRECEEGKGISIAGQPEHGLKILLSGANRVWYEKKGKAYTLEFYFAPELTGCPEAFITDKPAKYNVECVDQVRLALLQGEAIKKLSEEYADFSIWYKELTQSILLRLVKQHHYLYALSPADKIARLKKSGNEVLPKIRENDLATYAGTSVFDLRKML